jgi:hypothetical protein
MKSNGKTSGAIRAAATILAVLMLCLTGCAGGGAGDQTTAENAQSEKATEPPQTEEATTEEPYVSPYNSLDGKTVVFIGNSFVYYGGCVTNLDQRQDDPGMFKQLCIANGENTVVYDCTYGAHNLSDFTAKGCKNGKHNGSPTTPYNGCPGAGTDLIGGIDLEKVDYVFISEAGSNNSNFLTDCRAIMARFPNPETKFIYVAHSYTYFNNHNNIINGMKKLREENGVILVEWGKLVDDLINGRVAVENSAVSYKKTTFIVNKLDSHHPNMLSGYITALMCYCAITGRDPVGQAYEFALTTPSGTGTGDPPGCPADIDEFISRYYTAARATNCKQVMTSPTEMAGIQKLMRNYLADYLVQDANAG